jgi:cytochrome P450
MMVEAGTTVLALLAAANRDPEIFTDPDEIDIERHNAARHIAFGHGPHFCLGASLARLEGTLALRALAESVPQLAVTSSHIEWTSLGRVQSLPVRVGMGRRDDVSNHQMATLAQRTRQ